MLGGNRVSPVALLEEGARWPSNSAGADEGAVPFLIHVSTTGLYTYCRQYSLFWWHGSVKHMTLAPYDPICFRHGRRNENPSGVVITGRVSLVRAGHPEEAMEIQSPIQGDFHQSPFAMRKETSAPRRFDSVQGSGINNLIAERVIHMKYNTVERGPQSLARVLTIVLALIIALVS